MTSPLFDDEPPANRIARYTVPRQPDGHKALADSLERECESSAHTLVRLKAENAHLAAELGRYQFALSIRVIQVENLEKSQEWTSLAWRIAGCATLLAATFGGMLFWLTLSARTLHP